MTADIIEKIKKNGLFSHLSTQELQLRLRSTGCNLENYHSGQFILFKGDPYTSLLIIVKGSVNTEISNMDGKVLKIEKMTAPSTLASGILFADDNRLPVNLRAATELTMLVIPRDKLIELASQDQKILLKLLVDAGNRITGLAKKIHFMQMLTLEKKIAVYFMEQQGRNKGKSFTLPYSMEELSELFGVTRPALSRSIGMLVDEGILERSSRRYRVLKPKMLMNRAEMDHL